MSTYGFPDGQELTQWLGQPLEEATGLVIGAGSHVAGPFSLANFASVIVAIKPTGGQVTVKVTQGISGGPASLQLVEQVVVAAGATLFEAFVLFGDQVTIEFDGAAGGESIDYAIYPSNTTTNAQVITQATINVQHNDVLIAAEPTLDFEDVIGAAWSVVDDAGNTRVKLTPPQPGLVTVADVLLAAPAASFDFTGIPQTGVDLELEVSGRSTAAVSNDRFTLRVNNDATNSYWSQALRFNNGVSINDTDNPNPLFAAIGLFAGATSPAGSTGDAGIVFPNYRQTTFRKSARALGGMHIADAATNDYVVMFRGQWLNVAAINRLTVALSSGANFAAGSRATLRMKV